MSEFGYDAAGNAQTITDSPFGTQTFTYDLDSLGAPSPGKNRRVCGRTDSGWACWNIPRQLSLPVSECAGRLLVWACDVLARDHRRRPAARLVIVSLGPQEFTLVFAESQVITAAFTSACYCHLRPL